MTKNVLNLVQYNIQRGNNGKKIKILFCASLCLDVDPGITK